MAARQVLEDLGRVASGALGTLSGTRDQVESLVKARLDRVIDRLDLVSREEFETVRAVASKARAEQEALSARVAKLEAKLAALAPAGDAAPAAKPAAKPKTPRKRASRTAKSADPAPDSKQ